MYRSRCLPNLNGIFQSTHKRCYSRIPQHKLTPEKSEKTLMNFKL